MADLIEDSYMRFNDVLQSNRSNSSALEESMKEVDEWKKRFGKRLSTEATTTAG